MKTYISTFVPGFEKTVCDILPRLLQTAKIIHVYSGMVYYSVNNDSAKVEQYSFFNNTFRVIKSFHCKYPTFKQMTREIIRDKVQYDRQLGKNKNNTFRIRFSRENQFEKVDQHTALAAEAEVIKRTGLRLDRLNPTTEFWYIIRRENIAFYAQLLHKRKINEKNLNQGELRPELALLMIYWAQIRPIDTIMDPFAGFGSIPLQICKRFKYQKIILNDIDKSKYQLLKQTFAKYHKEKVTVLCHDTRCLEGIENRSVDIIITDPPWGIYEEITDVNLFYCSILDQFKRFLKQNGRIVILTAKKHELEKAAAECGLQITDKADTLVNGKKAALFKLMLLENSKSTIRSEVNVKLL